MEHQARACQNCKQPFVIESEDFDFYKKISVPPPTFCPECRLQRRYALRNQLHLYKTTCGLCHKSMVSMYSSDKPFPVYCPTCWWSDAWDARSFGRDFDFSRPFFEQFAELVHKVPRLSLMNERAVNSDYCNHALNTKDCYLCFSIGNCENCYYLGPQVVGNKNCVACSVARNNDLCAESVDCDQSYNLAYSQNCVGCMNSAFLLNCRNCQDCFGCVGLRNKEYYIFNEPYTKEQYGEKLTELNKGSYRSLIAFRAQFDAFKLKWPSCFATILNSVNVTGNNITNSKDCRRCFAVVDAEHCAYSFVLNGTKDSQDVDHSYPSTELSYEGVSVVESSHTLFCSVVRSGTVRAQYAETCAASSDIFGCISLRKGQYCILNKQYTKEEYEKLVQQITKHMDERPYIDKRERVYRYGEFFPAEISPFGYNESVAMEYFPLTKEEALSEGYAWRDPDLKDYRPTLLTSQIPDDIREVKEDIIKEVIECAHAGACGHGCVSAFRIVSGELQIYRQMNIPLPRTCPNCRYYERLNTRNPLKLWRRACACAGSTSSPQAGAKSQNGIYQNTAKHSHGEDPCPNEFETSYAPERPEIVYCEQCYNAEVA